MKAVPRGQQAPAPAMAPLIRSGDLFSNYGPDFQAEYFAAVAKSAAALR